MSSTSFRSFFSVDADSEQEQERTSSGRGSGSAGFVIPMESQEGCPSQRPVTTTKDSATATTSGPSRAPSTRPDGQPSSPEGVDRSAHVVDDREDRDGWRSPSVSVRTSAAKKRSSARSPTSPAAGAATVDAHIEVNDDSSEDDNDVAEENVREHRKPCGDAHHTGVVDPDDTRRGATDGIREADIVTRLGQMTLLHSVDTPHYFYSAFAATQEHLRDRLPTHVYTEALWSGPLEISFPPTMEENEDDVDSQATCDESENNERSEEESTDERSRRAARTPRKGRPRNGSSSGKGRSTSRPADSQRNSPVRKQTKQEGKASLSGKSRGPTLLDPLSTTFFKPSHDRSWTAKEEQADEEDGKMCHGARSNVRRGATLFLTKAPLEGGLPLKAEAAKEEEGGIDINVAELFRGAMQAVYDREDALLAALRQEEDRLLQERLQLLDGPHKSITPGAEASLPPPLPPAGASTASKMRRQRRQQQPQPPLDVFDTDLTPALNEAHLTCQQSHSPTHTKAPLRLVRTRNNSHNNGDSNSPAGAGRLIPLEADAYERLIALRKTQRAALMQVTRQRAEARAAEDQRTLLHRLQEHPCVVEDAVRYTLFLARLRAAHKGGDNPTGLLSATSGVSPPSSPLPSGVTGAAAAVAHTLPPSSGLAAGDGGQLLYQKYPPPLFRTTSFASETIRLLKWLRTWWQTEPAKPADAVASPPATKAVAKGSCQGRKGKPTGTGALAKPQNASVLEKMSAASDALSLCAALVDAQETSADIAPAEAKGRVKATTTSAAESKTPRVQKPDKQISASSEKNTLLSFFGAAVKKPAEPLKDARVDVDASGPKERPPRAKGARKRATSPTPETGTEQHALQDMALAPAKSAKTETNSAVTASASPSSSPPPPPPPPLAAAESAPPHPLTEALKCYCEGWRDAVNGNSAFSTTAGGGSTHRSPLTSPLPPPVSQAPQKPPTPAPRAATSLPFYKDMLKETDVLGSVAEVQYDRYGTRLRSARLAKKEAEWREKEEEQRRLLEKKRGYFTRTEEEREGDNMRGGVSDFDSSDSDDSEEARQDEITNIAVVSGPTGSGKTAAVYLAAHLLHFRVVEMNASIRRCPKNVERLLAELTRSYRLSGLSRGRNTLSIEEELQRLKREHAAIVAKMQAEEEAAAAVAAAEEAAKKAKKTAKANAISAKAVAAFFGAKPKTSKETASTAVASVTEVAHQDVDANDGAKPVNTTLTTATTIVEVEEEEDQKPASQQVSSSAPSAEAGNRTLLLVEDADILLGDESMKPFYAAIRDLAQRSNVPLVVTVSAAADEEGKRYYDRPPTLPAPLHSQQLLHGRTVASTNAQAGFSDRMSALSEAGMRLNEEDGIADANAFHHVALNARLAAHYFGKRTPFTRVDVMSRAALYAQLLAVAAVELDLVQVVPQTAAESVDVNDIRTSNHGTIEGIVQTALLSAKQQQQPGGAGSDISSEGDSDDSVASAGPSGARGRGRAGRSGGGRGRGRGCSATLNLKTDRTRGKKAGNRGQGGSSGRRGRGRGATRSSRGHFQLLDDDDEGSLSCSTTITTASSSLPSPSASNSRAPLMKDGKESQPSDKDEFSHCTGAVAGEGAFRLQVIHPLAFSRLAVMLRNEIFLQEQKDNEALAAVPRQHGCTNADTSLPLLSVGKAGCLATPDVRYWLNHLQYLLLTFKSSLIEDETPATPMIPQEPTAATAAPLRSETLFPSCAALSAADACYGRYRQSLAHNDLSCARQQHWQLEATIQYGDDVLRELDSLDHPTARSGYTMALPVAMIADVDGDEERDVVDVEEAEEAGPATKKPTKRGRGRPRKKDATSPVSPGVSPLASTSAPQLLPHATSKPSIASFFHMVSPPPSELSPSASNNANLVFPGSPAATASGLAAAAGTDPSTTFLSASLRQYCWESVLAEDSWRRPVECVLPYGDAQRWLAALDAEAATPARPTAMTAGGGGPPNPPALAAFPALPRRPVTFQVRGLPSPFTHVSHGGGHGGPSTGTTNSHTTSGNAGGHVSGTSGVGTSTAHATGTHSTAAASSLTGSGQAHTARLLPRTQSGPQQAWWTSTTERMAVFKTAWRRTRKTDNLKQFVVARAPAVAEDVMGFSSLTGPLPASYAKDATLL